MVLGVWSDEVITGTFKDNVKGCSYKRVVRFTLPMRKKILKLYDLLLKTGSIYEVIMSHHFCVDVASSLSYEPAHIMSNSKHLGAWKSDLQDRSFGPKSSWSDHKYSLV